MKGTYLIILSLFAMVVPSTVDAGRRCHKAFVVTKCSKDKGSCRRVKICVVKSPQAQRSAVAVVAAKAPVAGGLCRAQFLKDKSGKVIKVVREGCEAGKPAVKPGAPALPPFVKPTTAYSTAATSTGTMRAGTGTIVAEEDDETITDSEELDESSDEGEYDVVYDESDEE